MVEALMLTLNSLVDFLPENAAKAKTVDLHGRKAAKTYARDMPTVFNSIMVAEEIGLMTGWAISAQ